MESPGEISDVQEIVVDASLFYECTLACVN
jgi:hypothetical protein